MKCELGAESLRARWGRWGCCMAQTAVCVLGARDTATSRHPPPLYPTTTTNHHRYALSPGPSARSQEHLARLQLWLLKICRNPARSPCGDQRLSFGQDVEMRSTPRWLQRTPAVCLCCSSGFIYVTRRVEGVLNHPSRVQVFTLIPVK